ncbi:Hypothetical predicted protein [Podarcis lilfordi]|uniref:Uncharacterized protein n=1 Tax=Podarcis lilfordi TaxID=74358 RepID=A0AA35K7V1_9SAUR|nr:Hypothetical predicted protein [Podarcis lilfordi]
MSGWWFRTNRMKRRELRRSQWLRYPPPPNIPAMPGSFQDVIRFGRSPQRVFTRLLIIKEGM